MTGGLFAFRRETVLTVLIHAVAVKDDEGAVRILAPRATFLD
jgi:hypothetical protein